MNIFEFLGLPLNHRAEGKVTQLVKHYDEVPVSAKGGKSLAGQVKKDGVCSLTVVLENGDTRIFSRTGKEFTNTRGILDYIDDLHLPSGVYMGELWTPKSIASLEQVSGATNPNRVNPLGEDAIHIPRNLSMAFFDRVSIEQFKMGKCADSYIHRHSALLKCYHCNTHLRTDPLATATEVLPFCPVANEEEIDSLLLENVSNGEEGIVIRVLDANWEAGHKGWRVMKKVRGVDYDLVCIGYEEGTGKYTGKVANLLFKWKNGETIKAMLGKGWTHNMAQEMFDDIKASANTFGPLYPIGCIFQVYALEESSKGKLRLVKVGERRHDKTTPDV